MDPDFPGIQVQIVKMEKLREEKMEKMKTEVLSGLKSLGNTVLGNFGMSLDNFKMQQNPDGTCNITY